MDDIFAEETRREDHLFEELAACPECELTGIVSPSGIGAKRSDLQGLWSLLVRLDAWRVGSGPIQTKPLTLRRRVADDDLEKFEELIDPEAIVRIRARIAEDNVFGSPQGQLVEFIEFNSSDSGLEAHLAELHEPIEHKDARFGTLILDRSAGWYSGEVQWDGQTIELTVNAEEPNELESGLKVAYQLWDAESEWHDRVGNYAVKELLPLKNGNWLGDHETEFSSEQFKNRMTLEGISVDPDGSFEFWYDDGDLFLGHSIQVSGNLGDGLTHADIPG